MLLTEFSKRCLKPDRGLLSSCHDDPTWPLWRVEGRTIREALFRVTDYRVKLMVLTSWLGGAIVPFLYLSDLDCSGMVLYSLRA